MNLFRYFFFGLAVSYMTGGKGASQEFTYWFIRNVIAAALCVIYSFLVIGTLAAFGVDTGGAIYIAPLFVVLYVLWIIYDLVTSALKRRSSRKVNVDEFLKRTNAAKRRNLLSSK